MNTRWRQNVIILPSPMRRQLVFTSVILAVLAASACNTDSGTSATQPEQTVSSTRENAGTPNVQSTEVAEGRGQTKVDEADREPYLETVRRMMDIITPTVRILGGLAIQISTAEDGAPESVSQARVSRDTIALTLDTLTALEPSADLIELHSATIESVSTYLDASDVLISEAEFTFNAYSEFQSLMAKAGGQLHDASSLLAGAQR